MKLTLGELMDNWHWDKVCEVTGLNPWCLTEGIATREDEQEITDDQAREIGILPTKPMPTISEITREINRLKPLADELWAAKMAAEKEPLAKWLAVAREIDRLKGERDKLIEQMNSENK